MEFAKMGGNDGGTMWTGWGNWGIGGFQEGVQISDRSERTIVGRVCPGSVWVGLD